MSEQTPNTDLKVCPYCAETIKAAAVKCRFCQSDLTGTTEPQPPAAAPAEPDAVGPDSNPDSDPGDTGPAEPSALPSEEDPERVPLLASFRLTGILVALSLVLLAVSGFAWWRSENPEDGRAPTGAITSAEARDAGMQAASTLTQKVLSYNWKTLDADMLAAEALLAPSFRSEYAKAMNDVKTQTVKNQVKLTASVVATSIVSATEKKVDALVFVNQVTTAKGSGNQRLDQNRVLVTLTRDAGEWRVSKMDAF